jgi:hypothetical protein
VNKNFIKRKLIAVGLAVSVASATSLAPRRADAGLGILVTLAPELVLSPVVIPLYYLLAVAGGAAAVSKLEEAKASGSTFKYIQTVLIASFGLLMLDSKASGSMDFTPISDFTADRAGLTQAERLAYAAELPMLNAIREESFLRVDAHFKNAHPSLGEVADELRLQWRELSGQALSSEATSAMEKLATAAQRTDLE